MVLDLYLNFKSCMKTRIGPLQNYSMKRHI